VVVGWSKRKSLREEIELEVGLRSRVQKRRRKKGCLCMRKTKGYEVAEAHQKKAHVKKDEKKNERDVKDNKDERLDEKPNVKMLDGKSKLDEIAGHEDGVEKIDVKQVVKKMQVKMDAKGYGDERMDESWKLDEVVEAVVLEEILGRWIERKMNDEHTDEMIGGRKMLEVEAVVDVVDEARVLVECTDKKVEVEVRDVVVSLR
jgi:hypothetical protein